MALTQFTDNVAIVAALADLPNDTGGLTAAQFKAKFDAAATLIKAYLNNTLLAELAAIVDSDSGADNIGTTAITDLDGTTIQAVLESFRNKLKSITDGTSGADFVAATAISGLTGTTVQSLLEALKGYADSLGTALTDALATHKTSGDHDGRYFTETEMQATTDGSSGADRTGATQVSPGSGTTVQAIVEWLYLQITSITLGQIPDGSITPAKLSFDPATQVELDAHKADYSLQIPYAAAGGTVNVYTATLSPALASYAAGVALSVNINITNTGAATINVNGLGAKSILDSKGNAMTAGKLRATSIYTLRYNGTAFILQGEGGGGTALAADILAPKTATVDSGDVVGTMVDRAGDTAALSSTVVGTILKLLASAGFRDGVNDYVTLTDANFIAANIKNGIMLHGLLGTMPIGTQTATGTITPASGSLSITGLAFNPAKVMYYDCTTNPTTFLGMGIAVNPADMYGGSVGIVKSQYAEVSNPGGAAGYSANVAAVFGVGQVTGLTCRSGFTYRWFASE